MTYCFKCSDCGRVIEDSDRELTLHAYCPSCGGILRRDYQSENAGVTGLVQMKRERETGSAKDLAPLVLPQAGYFAGPSDPDGQKGLREWADGVRPKSDNKRPVYPPDLKRRSF